ncbi:defender against death DAD protein [Polychaeton citri CBS 116435]|uniref:Dolichyl-diphosphooligosaccharide--protein glycosyltransferase subunit OST2 n=1 Tax=Polychaeton citri CBS 116435 TaxID=1314669 RepID=A0A9P4UJS4_9PEZI|nr:defender against death DAD protein [Polychaeton citri CBS 116435]
MAPKKSSPSPAAVPPQTTKASSTVSSASSQPLKSTSSSAASTGSVKNSQDAQQILMVIWDNYVEKTPQRTKLLDCFMAFLILVGAVQFVYVVVAGNYPFNAFLSGFSACVGQFVLTASLRIQTNPENSSEFHEISHERAFADYVFGSLILHFFCINFIN